MGLFDNALEKTKEVLGVAYKKTSDAVVTEKQKFDISSLKSKREKDFAALGEIYFNEIKETEDLEGEVQELVSDIKVKNAEIARLTAEVEQSKNCRICPYCAAAIEKNAVYCSICGKKLD